MVSDHSSDDQSSDGGGGAKYSALSSIAPAVASTFCCWGPAALSIFGVAGATSSSTTTTVLSNVSRLRPRLLALSAAMISYSFYRVYGPPSKQQEHGACCSSSSTEQETEKAAQAHARNLRINRAVVWVSLGVALAGASYGRVSFPKKLLSPSTVGGRGGGGTFGATAGGVVTVKLHVDGMRCGGCANTVRKAIESVNGVQKVVVDHQTGSAIIEGKDVNKHAVQIAVAKAGYSVGR